VEARVTVERGRLTALITGANRMAFLFPLPLLSQGGGTFLSSRDTSTRLHFTPSAAPSSLTVATPDGRRYDLGRAAQ
jgi:hypothetical protein